jgi:hypothetical protein
MGSRRPNHRLNRRLNHSRKHSLSPSPSRRRSRNPNPSPNHNNHNSNSLTSPDLTRNRHRNTRNPKTRVSRQVATRPPSATVTVTATASVTTKPNCKRRPNRASPMRAQAKRQTTRRSLRSSSPAVVRWVLTSPLRTSPSGTVRNGPGWERSGCPLPKKLAGPASQNELGKGQAEGKADACVDGCRCIWDEACWIFIFLLFGSSLLVSMIPFLFFPKQSPDSPKMYAHVYVARQPWSQLRLYHIQIHN